MKILRKKFAFKIFSASVLLIFIISVSFTTIFILQQRKTLTDALIENGRLLTEVLAYHARVGVFSENEALLKDPVEGVFEQEGVLDVSVYNSKGKLLKRKKRTERGKGKSPGAGEGSVFQPLRKSDSFHYVENADSVAFWSTIASGAQFSSEESLFFDEDPIRRQNRLIGFVRIVVDKTLLGRRQEELLITGVLTGTIFLVMGLGFSYVLAKGMTKPLNRLTEGVKALGRGGRVEEVPVETVDEVGRLAEAFNGMSRSLKKREDALITSENTLRDLSSRLLEAQERERKRLSKELHDGFGHDLALLKLRLRSLKKKLPEDETSLRRDCDETAGTIDQIIDNVRRLSRDLSPSLLEDLGLSAALEWQAENFAEQNGINVSLDMVGIDKLLPLEAQINLYRVFQEILTNVSKHAQATQVTVFVRKEDGSITFHVEDDGKGYDMDRVMKKEPHRKGMGLTTIRERARMLHGSLDIQSQPGKGTRITLKIPT